MFRNGLKKEQQVVIIFLKSNWMSWVLLYKIKKWQTANVEGQTPWWFICLVRQYIILTYYFVLDIFWHKFSVHNFLIIRKIMSIIFACEF
jgi:hypothetical protein